MAEFKAGITRHLSAWVVIVSACIMGFLIFELTNTKRSIADQLINQSSTKLKNDLDDVFLPIEHLIMTIHHQQKSRIIKDFSAESLNRFFIPYIDQYPQVSSIAIADTRGYEFNIIPDTSGIWLNREVHVDRWGMVEHWDSWEFSRDDASLRHQEYWENDLKNDPRERPWFIGALKSQNESHWTEPYVYMTGDLGLTASIQWEGTSVDTLSHIIALDVTIQDLSQLSHRLRLTEHNQTYLLTASEEMKPDRYIQLSPLSDGQSPTILDPEDAREVTPLHVLLESPVDKVISFQNNGERWWGMVTSYSLSSSQPLFIAVVVPESDFASNIDRTIKAVLFGFIVILSLSILLLRNQNKLRSLSNELNKTNKIIEGQKQILISEVHHRVKNNLALISALIDIESMQSKNDDVILMLHKTRTRIQAITAIHERLYHTDDLNHVNVKDFVSEILTTLSANKNLQLEVNDSEINVNQALSYALLLNELMSVILNADHHQKDTIEVKIENSGNDLLTDIKISTKPKHFKPVRGVEMDLVDVLILQLNAKFRKIEEQNYVHYEIHFALEDVKGSMSNQRV